MILSDHTDCQPRAFPHAILGAPRNWWEGGEQSEEIHGLWNQTNRQLNPETLTYHMILGKILISEFQSPHLDEGGDSIFCHPVIDRID